MTNNLSRWLSTYGKRLSRIDPHEYRLTRWWFLRALAVVYLIAFASLATQVTGLIGSNGILPVADVIPAIQERYGTLEGVLRFPSLVWLNASDGFLAGLCVAGIVLALLLLANLAPALMLAGLWSLYLSLVLAGQVFLSFQWDFLLLEAGFLAIFLAPIWTDPRRIGQQRPSTIVIWLLRWLLFRVMFASGIVKILSGDPVWADFTALTYHYETQPLPTPLAWFAHQLPLWFHQLSALGMFFIELFVPFGFLLYRRIRYGAALLTITLQVLILLTGNYTFFNWLTMALCLTLLDDGLLRRLTPKRLLARMSEEARPTPRLRTVVSLLFAVFMLLLTGTRFLSQLQFIRTPGVMRPVLRTTAPFAIANTYGLFAIMTTDRPQIIVEGSSDGENWQAYRFRYQPQELDEAPPVVAPHQPRLDWQMWFAALDDVRYNRWFLAFVQRLLDGSPQVLALLEYSPFPPEAPPRFIRARVYNYTFTTWEQRRASGNWWQREFVGDYTPVIGR